MEIRYGFMILVGAAISLCLLIGLFFLEKKRKTYQKGIKVANMQLLMEDKYFKRMTIIYRVLQIGFVLVVIGGIMMSSMILSQPYRTKTTKEEKYSRDIMICLDISASVDDLNDKLVVELQDTVRHLSGERVGIVIFNTTPVLLSPLTDDYEYTIEQLENIHKGLKAMNSTIKTGELDNYLYWNSYLYGGTLVGNEERGSSLIGDGLMGAVLSFPKTEKKRTKIIIFSTDNDPNGEGYVTLKEAGEYCKKKDITVYGIGTDMMYSDDKEEMKQVVESTGGAFYLEENSSTFYQIVEEIDSKSASLVKGKTVVRKVEEPEQWYKYLIVAFGALLLLGIFMRRVSLFWAVRQVVVIVLLATMFTNVIKPARFSGMGDGMSVKASSNLQVLFVVDNTLSMQAEDYQGNRPRMEGVKEICSNVVEELNGAKFSVVTFNNSTTVLSPFSNNTDHILNVIDSISPVDDLYAKGSSLNTPKEVMLDILKTQVANERMQTVVIYISDGEITSEENLESYAELAQYTSGGAVLGYGTKEGGIMHIYNRWDDEAEPEILMDYSEYPMKEARSVIDEGNLKKIANDMNISYVHVTEGNELSGMLDSLRKNIQVEVVEEPVDTSVVHVENKDNPWYYLAIPILLMFVLEAILMVRKR